MAVLRNQRPNSTQVPLFDLPGPPSEPLFRLVHPQRFVAWYQRKFGVDLSASFHSLRTTRAAVEALNSQRYPLRLVRQVHPAPGGDRAEEARYLVLVGSFGCELGWLREPIAR